MISSNIMFCQKVKVVWLSWASLVSVCAPCLQSPFLTLTKSKGKSCFLYYLLFRLLNLKKTVALQVNGLFVLFGDTGVLLYDSFVDDIGHLIPPGTWAHTDSCPNYLQPCPAFMTTLSVGNAWVVQTTSPLEDRWALWQKKFSSPIYYMDVCQLEELIAIG